MGLQQPVYALRQTCATRTSYLRLMIHNLKLGRGAVASDLGGGTIMTGRENPGNATKNVYFIDSHCHLQDSRIRAHAGLLIREAKEAGVQRLVVNGTSEEDWQAVKQLSLDHSEVIPSFGLHPWYVGGRSAEWLSNLRSMLVELPGAAAGEAGLDKNAVKKTGCDMETQVEILIDQLRLAKELHRPIALHCVKAYGKLYDIIREMAPFPAGFILHSYGGPPDLVGPFSACGGYFSISGLITSLKRDKAKAILEKIPLDRLLLETDCPDAFPKMDAFTHVHESRLLKVQEEICGAGIEAGGTNPGEVEGCDFPHSVVDIERSTRTEKSLNHPANIVAVAKFVVGLCQMCYPDVTHRIFQNSLLVFSIRPEGKFVERSCG